MDAQRINYDVISKFKPLIHNYYHYVWWEDFLSEKDWETIWALKGWEELTQSVIGNGKGEVNRKTRSSKNFWMYPDSNNQELWDKLCHTTNYINQKFFRFNLTGFYEPAQVTYYGENQTGHYSWHIDELTQDGSTPRKLSMVLMLSDPKEFEGGNLEIYRGGEPETLELKKGRAYFFPSYIVHRVTPVLKGERKTLVMWAGGPMFK